MNKDILIQELEKTQVIEKAVHSLLLDDEKCRSNDNYLFGKVIEIIANNKGLPIDTNMQIVIDTFKNSNNPALLNYATVKRSRQKIQEHNPNLKSEEQIKKDLAECMHTITAHFMTMQDNKNYKQQVVVICC